MKNNLNGLRDLIQDVRAERGLASTFQHDFVTPASAPGKGAKDGDNFGGVRDQVADFLPDVIEFKFGEELSDPESHPEADLGDVAYARPSHAGSGKSTDDTTDNNGKGQGNKKAKDDSGSTDPVEDGTDPGDGGTDPVDDGTGTDTSDDSAGSDGGSDYVTADFVSGLDTPDGYNISVDFAGSWTAEMIDQLVFAAETLSDLIIGDLSDSVSALGLVDDIHITASITSIDGSGGYGGWGGYSSIGTSGLPSSGYLKLDSADVGSMLSGGYFDDFVLHEMLHAMGFGTLWSSLGLVKTINGELRFTGENAIEAYNTVYADIAANDPGSWLGVPVEMDGGSGTAGVHWDDAAFGNELMTGWLSRENVTSDMSVAALEDMGYQTVYGDALAFV